MNLLRSSTAGRFTFVAEALALVFVFLLPLKFGSIVGIPDITMIYWREWFPLVLSPWPPALLAPFAALLLLTVVLFVPKSPRWTWNGNQALLWLAFAGSGTLGAFAENTVVNYPMHMIPYGFGLACSALAFAMLHELVLHCSGKLHAAFHVLVLHELEHDVRLHRRGVEAFVAGRIIVFQQNHGVFAHGHVKVRFRLRKPEYERLRAHRRFAGGSVGVDRDEQICVVLVGQFGTVKQRRVRVALASIQHLHVRMLPLNECPQLECDSQVEFLLLRNGSQRTRVAPAMPGVYHQCERRLPPRHAPC